MTTYLVTGANRGIGLEFARELKKRGDTVLATTRDVARAEELAHLDVAVLTLDVSDPASIDGLRAQLKDRPVDVLINNAGVGSESKTIAGLDSAELTKVMQINAIGPMLVTRACLPNLRAGADKKIVNISSQLASIANNTGGSSYGYRASKAALNQFTVSLSNELKKEGFTAVTVHPGWVRTDMGGPNATLSVEQSVSALVKLIDGLTPKDTGRFLSYDGSSLPW